MTITGYTPNLRLRLSDDLTADALYNLQRLDTVGVGGTSNLDAGQTVSGVFATARLPVIPLSLGGLGQSLTSTSGIPLLTSGVLSFLSVGTAANDLVQLDAGGALPAVSGANLTNLPLSSFSGVLPLLQGGTGVAAGTANAALAALSPQTTKGDLLGFGTVPVRVPAGADGQVLTAQASTATGLTWTSPLTNPLTTMGDLIYGGTGGAANRLAADTSNTRRFLRTQSVGGSPSAPVWDSLQAGDIPTLNQNTTGTAANVTGVVDVANGGTGATSTTGARAGIGAAASGANSDITSLTGLTTPLSVGQGGTGATTQAAALTALAGAQTSGHYLRSDGTNTTLAAIQAADVPVLNQDTTGKAANVTGVVAVANGGTGATTQAAALTALAGTQSAGKYLRSDGTNTALASIQAADVPTLNQNTTGTAGNVTGVVAPANGGTGVANNAANTLTFSGAYALALTLAGATSVTLPTSGTLATLAGTETLSSKTLTAPLLSSYADLAQIAKPANPSASTDRLYVKNDDNLYLLTSAGVEKQVGSGGGLTTTYQASAATASSGINYLCNTTSAAFTMTLPSGSAGAIIRFTDDAGTWATNNLTIAPASGQTIQGISGNGSLVCNLSGAYVELSWDSTNSYWVVQASGFQYGPIASTTLAGIISTTSQSFAGAKQFTSGGYYGNTPTVLYTSVSLPTSGSATGISSITTELSDSSYFTSQSVSSGIVTITVGRIGYYRVTVSMWTASSASTTGNFFRCDLNPSNGATASLVYPVYAGSNINLTFDAENADQQDGFTVFESIWNATASGQTITFDPSGYQIFTSGTHTLYVSVAICPI